MTLPDGVLPILALVAVLSSCSAHNGAAASETKRRILAALPPRWCLARTVPGTTPFEQQSADGRRGEELILQGPRTIRVEGYYCDGSYCAVVAKEALELWIMPAGYRDGQDVPALQAWRVAERIGGSGKVEVFALASRDWGGTGAFDRSYNGSSHEFPTPPRGTDLPLSWTGWRADLAAALRTSG